MDFEVVVDAEVVYGDLGVGKGTGICDLDVAATEGKEVPHRDAKVTTEICQSSQAKMRLV